MKKLFFFFVCAAIAAACSSEMEVPSPINPDDEMVEVSFNLAGDYVSVEETPMTRADEGKTYYFIQLFTVGYYEERFPNAEFTDLYAYGLFTSLDNARLLIPAGYNLIAEALVIKEREDKLYISDDGTVGHPFKQKALDNFVIDDFSGYGYPLSERLPIGEYGADVAPNNVFKECPMIERYHGRSPITKAASQMITIPLNRYSFSLSIDIVKPYDGRVVVGFKGFKGDDYICQRSSNDPDGIKTFIFNAPLDINEQGSKNVDLTVKWIRTTEDELTDKYIANKTINIKRNTNYNIRIDMNDRNEQFGFSMEMKDEEWSQENLEIE